MGFTRSPIQADVSEERLRRFFTKEHRGYRARRELRECVLFAVHDLLKDAPFRKMDLFTCRNLLIYLTAEAQKRVFDTAHFALRPGGLLFLGSSESAEEESGRGSRSTRSTGSTGSGPACGRSCPLPIGPGTLARALRRRRSGRRGGPYVPGAGLCPRSRRRPLRQTAEEDDGRKVSWEELHFKLIERFAPPSLIVTRDYDIVHVSENAGPLPALSAAASRA